MTSEACVLANRRNARKSTGPKTQEGKAIVAQNAVKHGLLARQAVLKDEDPAEFELHRGRLLQSLAPEGQEQELLAERIVRLWWRLQRAERMQDEALDYLIEADRGDGWVKLRRSDGDPSAGRDLAFGRAVARDFAEARSLDRLSMLERRIESSLYRTMDQLRRLKPAGQSRPPVETPHLASPDEMAVNVACCAKQSQSGEVASLKCGVSSGANPAPEGGPWCETKPMEAGESVCSVPVRAYEATPDGVTTNASDSAKQSQSGEVASLKCEVSSGAGPAPEGGPLCETKPMPPAVQRSPGRAAGAVGGAVPLP